MKRMIYSSIANLADESLELFWIAGLCLDEKTQLARTLCISWKTKLKSLLSASYRLV